MTNLIMTKKEVTKLSYEITGLAIKVHKKLGPGLLESVYEQCLKFELERNGYEVKQQVNIKIEYDNLELESTLRIDLLVNDTIIIELKTVEYLLEVYESQILNYLKATKCEVGILLNFGKDPQFIRKIFTNNFKKNKF